MTANTDSLRLTTLENEHRTQVEPDIDALESWRSEMRGAWRVILVVVSILTSAVGLNILLTIATLAQHKP